MGYAGPGCESRSRRLQAGAVVSVSGVRSVTDLESLANQHEPTAAGPSPGDGPATKRTKRGIKRRTAILEATLRILGRDGVSAVTHRNVAHEAGVPIAATTYYFASKDDLIAEAFRLHAENEACRVANLASSMDAGLTADQLADRLADFLYYGLHSGRLSLTAEYELLLQAARRPTLEGYSRVFYDSLQAELERTLVQIGSTNPALDARLVLATLAGIEVDNLSTPSRPLGRALLRSLARRLLHALLRAP